MTDEPTDHEAVKRQASPLSELDDETQSPALDSLAQRVETDCAAELARIVAGADQVDVLWDYFMTLPWQAAMPAFEELYDQGDPVHFISWAFAWDSQKVVFQYAQVPMDYLRLFLLHVVVTRILRPDTDPPDLQLVGP